MIPQKNTVKQYVLIAEDHPDQLEILQSYIEKVVNDLDVLRAKTTQEVRDKLAGFHDRMSFVILDLGLPESDRDIWDSDYFYGVSLLEEILDKYQDLNILIRSTDPRKAAPLRDKILNHQGFISVAHKQDDSDTTLKRMRFVARNQVSQDSRCMLDLNVIDFHLGKYDLNRLQLRILTLAAQAYDNEAILSRLQAEGCKKITTARSVNNYLHVVGKKLDIVDVGDGKDFRVLLLNKAREKGLVS